MYLSAQRSFFALSLIFGSVLSAVLTHAETPRFVQESLYSPNAAPIAEVLTSHSMDVVIVDGGSEQGLQRGMVCRVVRGFQDVGELLIIESKKNRAAALILELKEETFIQKGDIARIKTLQNS